MQTRVKQIKYPLVMFMCNHVWWVLSFYACFLSYNDCFWRVDFERRADHVAQVYIKIKLFPGQNYGLPCWVCRRLMYSPCKQGISFLVLSVCLTVTLCVSLEVMNVRKRNVIKRPLLGRMSWCTKVSCSAFSRHTFYHNPHIPLTSGDTVHSGSVACGCDKDAAHEIIISNVSYVCD